MAITAVEWVEVDGERYLINGSGQRGGWSPSRLPLEVGQVGGKRVQSPFVDAEWISGALGEGLRTATDDAEGYYSASGMEPHTEVPTSGSLRMKVGRSFSEAWTAVASAGGYRALTVRNNLLYALRTDVAIVDEWTGTGAPTARDFSASVGVGAVGISMIAARGKVYIGTSDNKIVVWDGAAFAVLTPSGGSGAVYVFGHSSDWVYLWFADLTAAGITRIRTINIDTSAFLTHAQFPNGNFASGAIIGGIPHWAIYFSSDTRQPRSELFTAASDSGAAAQAPTRVLRIPDNYPLVMREYRGEAYMGMAWGGSVRKLSGASLEEIGHFGDTVAPATAPGTDGAWALVPFGDSLYATMVDAASATGTRVKLRRYRLDEAGVGGWHLISSGGNDLSTTIRSMAAFQQTLVFGDDEVANGRVYEHSKTARLTSASIILPNFDYGAPTLEKRFHRASLRHVALLSGQVVALSYILNDAAAVSVGSNLDIGSTETVFELPETLRGSRMRLQWTFTNGAAQDLIVSPSALRMTPAPDMVEVWLIDTQLGAADWLVGSEYSDGVIETVDAYTKWETLQALHDQAQVFQVVGPFRDEFVPKRAMLAMFDPQVPLEPVFSGCYGATDGSEDIKIQLRAIQAVHAAGNLLLNASFEQNASGIAPTSWAASGTTTSDDCSNTHAQDGVNSLKLVFTGAANDSPGRTQSVAGLIPGRWHTLSAYVWRGTLSAGAFIVNVFESGVIDQSIAILVPGTDTEWVRYEGAFELPEDSSGTVSVRLLGITTPSGTVYIDAVQLEESIPASTFRERGSGG